MNFRIWITVALPLVTLALFLFWQTFNHYCCFFYELQSEFLSLQSLLLVCLVVWCITLIFLNFHWRDLLLVGLLFVAIFQFYAGPSGFPRTADVLFLFSGVTLGKGTQFLLKRGNRKAERSHYQNAERVFQREIFRIFMVAFVGLIAFSAWWHLDMAGPYHGPRWMGLWDNPNDYGMLMGTGVVISIGLLDQRLKTQIVKRKLERESGNFLLRFLHFFAARPNLSYGDSTSTSDWAVGSRALSIFLFFAAAVMAMGLLFSYSRGAWLATTYGLIYLSFCYGNFRWRWVFTGILIFAAVECIFWHSTTDATPWYLKRLDFSRASAQHRIAAWKAAVDIMWDHPLGVGWNKSVSTYEQSYSPPEGGAAALTMNSYLMLGTQLGLPGLLCFVAYVALQLGVIHWKIGVGILNSEFGFESACRAGAIVLLVAFWFDGGLFTLPTAATFWILLELGNVHHECTRINSND